KSPTHVLALEEALKYYLEEKSNEAEKLERQGNNGAELQLLKLYEEIDRVQASVRPLLPLTDKNGYKADIHLQDVSAELSRYRNQAADFLYATALKDLEEGKKGNKTAARNAYQSLAEMTKISGPTSHITNLQGEAKVLGTT